MPVAALLDCFQAGDRLDDFLADFPTVSREQVNAVLQIAGEAVELQRRSH